MASSQGSFIKSGVVLIVVGPVEDDDNLRPVPDDKGDPRGEEVPNVDARIGEEAVHLGWSSDDLGLQHVETWCAHTGPARAKDNNVAQIRDGSVSAV